MLMPKIYNNFKRYGLIKEEEFISLIREYRKTKSEKLFNKIYHHSLRFVLFFVVKKYKKFTECFEDLVQEGNIALIEAIKRFDPDRNIKFTYYAGIWIKAYVGRYLTEHLYPIRIPAHRVAKLKRFYRSEETIPDATLYYFHKLVQPQTDVEHNNVSHIENHDKNLVMDIILNIIDKLPLEQHKDMVRLYFLQDHTYQEIADKYGLTRERIRQIVEKNLKILKEELIKIGIDSPTALL